MDPNAQKEQYSNAYLRAVAATAGYNVYKPEVDDDSVDWGIGVRGGGGTIRSPRLELQLKCTGRDLVLDDHIAFPLPVKNYEELRHDDYQVPRVLVVVVVPAEACNWIVQTEESLVLRHCAYWLTLCGRAATANSETVTVHVPRANQFSVEALQAMMERIKTGGRP